MEEQQQLYPRIVELITCRLSVERRQANVKSFTVKAINFNQSDSEALLSQLRDANGDFIGPHLEFLTIENDSLSHIQLSSSFIIPLPISHPPDSPVMCDKRPAVSLDAYRRVNSGSPFPSEDLQSHLAQFSRMKLIRTKKKRIVKSPEMEISASPIASSVAGPISSSSASLCVSPKKNSSIISGERSPIEIHFCGKDVINSSPETSSIARPLPIRKAAAKPANSSPLASPTGQSLLLSPDLLSSLQAYRGKRRSSFQGSLVGSYEESILNGRLSAPPSKPIEFHCQIGVLAMGKTEKRLRCPPHVVIPFSASFYEWQQSRNNNSNKRSSLPSDKSKDRPADQAGREMRTNSLQPTSNTLFTSIADELGTPFVGVVDLEWGLGPGNGFGYAFMNGDSSAVTNLPPHRSPDDPIGYWQIPVKGQLQLLVKNPNKAAIKVFLIPYDLQAMPPSTKTFLRQKSLETLPADGSIEKGPLRYAAHLQFACLPALASPGNDDDDLSSIISPLSSLSTSPASSSTAFPLSTTRSTSSSSSSSRRKHLRYFLCKSIRLVFGQRASETGENLQVVYEMPDGRFPSGTCAPVDPSLRYLPLSSPPFL